jgi:pimeloyl-ACP methyl ester carboxylesterase
MRTRKGTIEVNSAELDRGRSADMVRTDGSTMTRVVSRDGTQIAYRTSGEGPPFVLVHGTTADHERWRPLLPYLEPHATVHAMDRRGRGASGDAPDYDVAREFEDVAAVVDAVAEASGSAVDVLGHSFGGLCAFGSAALTSNIRTLVLYEGWPSPNPDLLALPLGVEERLDALLAEGNREAVLETFFREVVKMPDEEFAVYRALPAWQARIAAAHTMPRELRAEHEAPFDPEQAAKLTVPILMLVGGDSPDNIKGDYETVAAALPDVRITVLDGQQHIAIDLVPEVFADHVVAFLRDQR